MYYSSVTPHARAVCPCHSRPTTLTRAGDAVCTATGRVVTSRVRASFYCPSTRATFTVEPRRPRLGGRVGLRTATGKLQRDQSTRFQDKKTAVRADRRREKLSRHVMAYCTRLFAPSLQNPALSLLEVWARRPRNEQDTKTKPAALAAIVLASRLRPALRANMPIALCAYELSLKKVTSLVDYVKKMKAVVQSCGVYAGTQASGLSSATRWLSFLRRRGDALADDAGAKQLLRMMIKVVDEEELASAPDPVALALLQVVSYAVRGRLIDKKHANLIASASTCRKTLQRMGAQSAVVTTVTENVSSQAMKENLRTFWSEIVA